MTPQGRLSQTFESATRCNMLRSDQFPLSNTPGLSTELPLHSLGPSPRADHVEYSLSCLDLECEETFASPYQAKATEISTMGLRAPKAESLKSSGTRRFFDAERAASKVA